MTLQKAKFIEDVLISNAIYGAFGRANVYAAGTESDLKREELRKELGNLLHELGPQYNNQVSGEAHKANIKKIADDLTTRFKDRGVLRGNRFRIGIAQKALNLYLKYLWCMDMISTPPHCPFDSQIIAELPLSEQEKIDLQWTKLDSLDAYQTLVDAALRKIDTGYPSLSEWELAEWARLRR